MMPVVLTAHHPAGGRLDNCMNNTGTVGTSLRVHNVDTQVGGIGWLRVCELHHGCGRCRLKRAQGCSQAHEPVRCPLATIACSTAAVDRVPAQLDRLQVPLLLLTGQGSVDEELLGSAFASLQSEG